MNHYFQTLELHKVLERLAEETSNSRTRQMALEIEPSADPARVQQLLGMTEDALQLSIQYGTPPFYQMEDVCAPLLRAKSGSRISLRELLSVARLLNQIQSLDDWYCHCENSETSLAYLFSRLAPNPALRDKLERSILSEEEIADGASTALASIRRKIAQSGQKLRDTLDKMIRSASMQKYLQESIVTLRDGRYVLPVKAEHRGDVQGLIHDTSATGQTYFIEPIAIVEANNDIRLLESQEQEEIERIITNLCAECGAYADVLIENYHVCAELNLYFAKANLAAKMKATLPQLTDDGAVVLKKARHPLLDPAKVVPIDVTLGREYQALIITGPNTGGKTVALKTVGLLCAMAMCGLLIPAGDGSSVSVFSYILVDIGDAQSIEQNLSTFSAHTNHVIEILKTADAQSLVLLDELGSGTDPVEGAALAVSVIEQLKRQGAKLMTTTHYQELKLYAIETPDVENASCEFDLETLQPTYRLLIGSPGKSNAFAISEHLGMPPQIIAYAKTLVSTEQTRFESVIEKLEAARAELDTQNQQLRQARLEAQAHEQALREQLKQLEQEKDAALEQARQSAMQIIENTKIESNRLIDELEQLRHEKDRETFSDRVSQLKSRTKNSFARMHDAANPVQQRMQEQYKLPRPLKKGDTVYVTDIDKQGTVLAEPDSSNMVFVQIGIMKTKVKLENLRLQQAAKVMLNGKKRQPAKKSVSSKVTRSAAMELDIRGCAADEGVYQMEAFLDSALVSGISTVTIIHGKGTGVLRAAVHRRLKELKYVKSFRLGVFGEGEDGVTIVELK